MMIGKLKMLLVAMLLIGSATAATAQSEDFASYYLPGPLDIPSEQHRFYDRNSIDFNS